MRGTLWALVALALSACGGGGSVSEPAPLPVPLSTPAPTPAPTPPIVSGPTGPMCAVAWGDSLTAGHGTIMPQEPYPARLADMHARDVRNRGIAGQTSEEILARIRAPEAEADRACIALLWMGTNNFWTPQAQLDIMSATYHQTSVRWLVLSIINADDWTKLTWQWANIKTLNDALKWTYGERYVDVRQALIDAADPQSPDDMADVAAGVIPRSLRMDGLHLNPRGYDIIARTVADKLRQLGW